jgi:crotonobetainyl-CoA:carnitine CoA-transferase CaiB-like acyl-CoA transferase
MAGTPVQAGRPAPRLGEHTFEVLRDALGLSAAEISSLAAQGVVHLLKEPQ